MCANMVANRTFSMPSPADGECAAPGIVVGAFATVRKQGIPVHSHCGFVGSLPSTLQIKNFFHGNLDPQHCAGQNMRNIV